MFRSRLHRALVKRGRTTMDSRRLDREAAARYGPSQSTEREPQSDVPRFGVRPSRH
ncbi:hypothetical protein OKW38_002957 [Paraburkholderia sp. MM5496-R1]